MVINVSSCAVFLLANAMNMDEIFRLIFKGNKMKDIFCASFPNANYQKLISILISI